MTSTPAVDHPGAARATGLNGTRESGITSQRGAAPRRRGGAGAMAAGVFRYAMGGAVVVHGAALLVLTALPLSSPVDGASSSERAPTWEVELELIPEPDEPAAAAPSGVGGAFEGAALAHSLSAPSTASRSPARPDHTLADPSETAGAGGDPTIVPRPAASPRTRRSQAGRRKLSLAQLGVGSRAPQAWVFPEGAPTGHDGTTERRLDRALRQGMRDADRRRGLGAGGPAITALQVAVRRSDVPARGRAVFLVTADSSGRVSSLSLLSATGKKAGWSRAAARAQRALAKRRLAVPKGARGVSLRIEVVSRVQLPSGADPGLGVSVAGIPIKKGKGPRSTHLELLVPTLRGDLSDIGSEEIRVVSARVLSEQVL